MSGVNPYSPPASDPTPVRQDSGEPKLATLGERLGGALIDGLISLVALLPIWYLVNMVYPSYDFLSEANRADSIQSAVDILIGYGVFVAIQWKFLKATGQTIGKKMAHTRIVTVSGKKPTTGDLIFKRYLFMNMISLVPVIGGFLSLGDILFIFRKDRRCLHDLIAGTQVVKFPPGEPIS